ncbi:hypothetical protein AHZ41_14095 [Salmonella enterica]|nr:hypothetical protein [Salmonella enterica]
MNTVTINNKQLPAIEYRGQHVKEQSVLVVPEELSMASKLPLMSDQLMVVGYVKGWNACREAMLQSKDE